MCVYVSLFIFTRTQCLRTKSKSEFGELIVEIQRQLISFLLRQFVDKTKTP